MHLPGPNRTQSYRPIRDLHFPNPTRLSTRIDVCGPVEPVIHVISSPGPQVGTDCRDISPLNFFPLLSISIEFFFWPLIRFLLNRQYGLNRWERSHHSGREAPKGRPRENQVLEGKIFPNFELAPRSSS